jgi:glyoxylase-like metal-dependent hydrolase (beta-lactamase superfamily II)
MSMNSRPAIFDRESRESPPAALPWLTFSDRATFHINGHDVERIHIAYAHTDGDAIVWFKDLNVMHAGAIPFNGQYPGSTSAPEARSTE